MRIACLVLLASSLVFAQKTQKETKETELKKTIAAGFTELAAWCQPKGLLAEGRPLVDEALGLDPDNAQAKALKEKLAGASAGLGAGDSTAGDPVRKEYDSKLALYHKRLAQLYQELSTQKHQQKDDERFDGYLLRAFELDTKAMGQSIGAEWTAAYQKKDWARAYRLLAGAQRIQDDPGRAKALAEVELKAAETKSIVKKASSHPMEYYLVLPKDWSPKRKWPVVVYVEGAGCNFRPAIDNYASQRGDTPFLMITPETFSSTNQLSKDRYTYKQDLIDQYQSGNRLQFDEEGLLAVIADVKRDYAADDKFFITGFSGGGNLAWRMIFGHPEMLAAAAPCCPNFATSGPISAAPERETLPIHEFQGEADEYRQTINGAPGLEASWEQAKKLLDANGFKNVERTVVPKVGHSPFMKESLDFFRAHLGK